MFGIRSRLLLTEQPRFSFQGACVNGGAATHLLLVFAHVGNAAALNLESDEVFGSPSRGRPTRVARPRSLHRRRSRSWPRSRHEEHTGEDEAAAQVPRYPESLVPQGEGSARGDERLDRRGRRSPGG